MSAAAPAPGTALDVRPLRHPAHFLDLQRAFYRGDPAYVPPVTAAEAWQIDPRRNPFFRHADAEFFAAYRGREPVGRISAVRDRLHDEFHGDRVGFFGHFEAADAPAAAALLETAAKWCRDRGALALRGPVDLSTNYKCGLLVGGDPGPPILLMPHNPPAYADWIEAAGLRKAKDLLALYGSEETVDVERVSRIVARVRRSNRAVLRRVDMKRFAAECELLWDLYNRIWERNWGFVPMSRDEFLAQAKDLEKIANPALLHLAELDGKPVGFVVALPDVNVGAKACKGRLLPFGWLRFLRAMRRVDTLRVVTLGVLPEHRKQGLEVLLMHAVIENGLAAGFRASEASWILEDNRDMLAPLESLGYREYRRYRIYEKGLR